MSINIKTAFERKYIYQTTNKRYCDYDDNKPNLLSSAILSNLLAAREAEYSLSLSRMSRRGKDNSGSNKVQPIPNMGKILICPCLFFCEMGIGTHS